MIGDQNDMLGRLKAQLPTSWFKGSTPVLDGLLNGFAYTLSLGYSLIAYVRLQTRIATATDGFLDLISFDFLGKTLPRKTLEQDNPFRARILSAILREKGTRKGMILALQTLTGRTPIIFEPLRPADTQGIGVTFAVGVYGGIGSASYPYQAFLTAFRPIGFGIPNLPGIGDPQFGIGVTGVVASQDLVSGGVTDADIYATIEATKPVASTIWTNISN